MNTTDQFPELMRRVQAVVREAFPIESAKHSLTASNYRWTDVGSSIEEDPSRHKDAKLKERTLSAKLVADLSLKEKGGRVVDTERGFVLLMLPHITTRSSYIVNGNEVQTVNQLRLRPGPYTRFTSDNNTETFINAAGGGYRIIFNRETKVLRLRSGSTYVYLYPILSGLGVTDGQIENAWGIEILDANRKHNKPEQMETLYRTMRRHSEVPKDSASLSAAVDSFFKSKELDPRISKITLRQAFDKITPQVLLEASSKAINLAGGSAEPDDTESLAFKSIHSIEDFIPEKLGKAIPGVKYSVARMMDKKPKITSLISPASFSDPVINWFQTSEFTRYSNQMNPLDILSTSQLTTTMGEGGIKSMHSITDQLRVVHPSQMGFLDPLHTPEGGKIGVTGHLTLGAQKRGNTLVTKVVVTRTGAVVDRTPQDLEDTVVSFPDQYTMGKGPPKPKSPMVRARIRGEIKMIPARDVEYIFQTPREFFSITSNSVPFLNTDHGNRILMGDRHHEQAVSLIDPDRPIVQAKYDENLGYEDFIGASTNPISPVDGHVLSVSRDKITIMGTNKKKHDVSLHNNYPLNAGTLLTERSSVQVGDKVKRDQVIAQNNFTKDGSLAIGKNLRVAYLPYKGYNFEDGVVISEGAAKKLTSEHAHIMRLDLTSQMKVGLESWLANFPDEAVKVDRNKYDTTGIIKKGERVENGNLLIPAIEQVTPNEEYDYDKLHKSFRQPWRNRAVMWESDFVGEVIDVVKTSRFIKVVVRTEEAMQIGDKVSNRHGAKGIVVNIIPDNEMYQDDSGKPVDMLFNPAGIGGRINPGQMFEGAAGKIADKTGKTYIAPDFDSKERVISRVQNEMKRAGLDAGSEETLKDPVSGNEIPNVYVGNIHTMKLQHQVRKKFNARGIGSYTGDEQPSKGGGDGSAQNIGSGELFSLLAAGSTNFLRDATTLKSQSNPEYWRAVRMGMPTPPPQQPFILDKFVSFLEGSGINVTRNGTILKALPMTDTEVKLRSRGEIRNPLVVRATDLKPEDGGLFDRGVTGGYNGVNWSHIKLETPMPNPLMERPIMALTNLKPSEFKSIIRGSTFVAKDGTLTTDPDRGLPAGVGLKALLSKIDVDKDLKETINEIRTAKESKLDTLNKKRRYLEALQAAKMRPEEAYIQSMIPVVPPKFRPIYPLPSGALNVADSNHMYREILMINNQLKDLKSQGMDNKNMARMRADLYGAIQGMTGMEEPLTRANNFKGFIATIKGRQNKYGLFQGRVVKRPQDLSGRSTVIPDPKLGIDEIGIPMEMGMEIYKPFVMRRLVTAGYKPLEARDKIEISDEQAVIALKQEMEERPVYMNRAPTLHKFGILPFLPKPVDGKAIHVNPLIVSGFNMDFDGDTVGIHVPVSEDARTEAYEKLPSRQLFAVTDNRLMHAPSKEAVLGIYLMTKPKGQQVSASTIDDMLTKFQRKEIKVNTPVKIGSKIWTPGQALINDALPLDSKIDNVTVDKGMLNRLLYEVSKKHPKRAGQIISKMKDLGNHYVTEVGFSVSLNDLVFDYNKRDKVLAKAAVSAKREGFDVAYSNAVGQLQDLVGQDKKNRFVEAHMTSGAFGKGNEITQLVASPVAVTDHKGKIIPVSIDRSYAEGHDISSFWATLPGARKGLADKGLKTADTGALGKKLVNTTIEEVVSMSDCMTTSGIDLPVESREALDRVVAEGPHRGRTVSPDLVKALKGRGVNNIKVRSPVTCQAVKGCCSKCFGLLENGQFPSVGYHLGVLAGQAISEPLTQLTLRAFHTGGAIGNKSVGFDRVKQILEMPENVPGKATIAQNSGIVTDVKSSAAGGWFVDIGSTDHFVPLELGIAVKKGQKVEAGQLLSKSGVIKPQDLLAATGDIGRVRNQMIDDLSGELSAGGVRIKRRLIETAIRPMTTRAEVTDAGDGEKYGVFRGDVISVNRIDELNKLIGRGRKIEYNPTLISIRVAPYHSGDFIGKLMFERPHETIMAAPALGATADIRSGHPITQYAFGTYFGKDKDFDINKI